jgi:hypothetical protein
MKRKRKKKNLPRTAETGGKKRKLCIIYYTAQTDMGGYQMRALVQALSVAR